MKRMAWRETVGLLALSLLLASCGPVPPEPQAGGGIGGTGSVATVAFGPVTGFGSVFVSETEYDNAETIYCLEDNPCTKDRTDLAVGMIVLLKGSVVEDYASGQTLKRVAETVIYRETVEGEVQAIASDGLSLIVLGQVVHLNQSTIIDPSIPGQAIENLQRDDVVEISGFVTGDGQILATLIRKHSGTPHYEVHGTVKAHDPDKKTFQIGALVVDYASADIAQLPVPPSRPWDGIVVHVRGDHWHSGGPGPYGATLTATKVVPFGLGVDHGAEAELEGFILAVTAPGDFTVNNQRITTSSSTVFAGGTVNDVVVGAHVEIDGHLVNGVLEAERVTFKGKAEVESDVASIDTDANRMTLVGFTALNIVVDAETTFEGNESPRRLADIRIGEHLKIHGSPSGPNGLVATKVKRTAPSPKAELEGPIQSIEDSRLALVGTVVETAGIADDGFIGNAGTVIGRSDFFKLVAIGHKVTMKGTLTHSGIRWTSVRWSGDK